MILHGMKAYQVDIEWLERRGILQEFRACFQQPGFGSFGFAGRGCVSSSNSGLLLPRLLGEGRPKRQPGKRGNAELDPDMLAQ
jgi:hypothetical protein